MSLNLWLLYVSLATALIATPGPSALLCVSHAVSHGARKTIATIVGGITASMTLMTLSALGLGAVIAASDAWFQTIKWAGAAYLVYLGISAWRTRPAAQQAMPQDGAAPISVPSTSQADASSWKLYRKGFMVGIGNPKDLLFFSALFPQFMDPSAPIAMQMVILGATWMVLDGSIMFAYALCGAKVMARLARLARGGAGQWFHRITGGAFIAAGGLLATAHR